MTDRYCVFGNPIGHSKSPFIHTAFARETQQTLDYTTWLAPVGGFAEAWKAFTAEGGRGANVTVPFKGDAFALCDTLSKRAQRAEAVNTLILGGNGKVYGDTTDGVGLVRDLHHHGVPLTGKRILLLGAGGAVRGVIEPLLADNPRELVIANRTLAKAERLAHDFSDLGTLSAAGFSDVTGAFDVVINGTSASLAGELPPLPAGIFSANAWAYDMMYAAEPTVFSAWAAAQGAQTLDGLGMLVEQAAESFFLWRNVRPDTASVRRALRAAL